MSSALMPPSTMQDTYWLISDFDDSMTPLGRDSVPEVYIRRSGSSSSTATSGACGEPSVIQVPTSSQSPDGAVPPRAIQPRTPPVSPETAMALSAVGARVSSVIRPFAPLWPRMKPISSALSMKLTGTRMTPRRAVAKASTANSHELCDSNASRSPFSRPFAARVFAQRFTASSNSAKVARRSPATTASLVG
jgi:hypothetical protein